MSPGWTKRSDEERINQIQIFMNLSTLKNHPAFQEALELVRPVVANIEAKPAITQNRYDAYLTALTLAKNKSERQLLALAMFEAGGNKDGIATALKLCGDQ